MSRLSYLEYLIAAIAVILGWFVVADELRSVGWRSDGGTAWLVASAAVATIGMALLTFSLLAARRAWAWIGLALVTASPTVFFYPLSIAVALLALFELVAMLRARRSERLPVTAKTTP